MKERVLIKKVQVENNGMNGNEKFELEYYLLNTERGDYGVEIKKKHQNEEESKEIIDIVRDKDNTIEILEKLARNQVTPTTLEYIIEDYLGIA